MYHYTLKIVMAGLSEGQLTALRNVTPEENFNYQFIVSDKLDINQYLSSYVYIFAGEITDDIKQFFVKMNQRKHVCLVLFTDISKLDAEMAELAEEVWPDNASEEIIACLFAKTMKRIKMAADKNLTENYLDTLIDNMPDMVWFKDKIGAHIKVNKKFCEVVGKTKEDIKGRGHCYIWDMDPKEYAEGEYICMETEIPVLEQGKSFMFEETVKYGNTLHYLNTYKSPIFDQNHQVIGTVGFARDITDVWTSRSELMLLLNNLPAPCLLYNANMRVVAVNTSFCKTYNVDEKVIVGKKGMDEFSQIVPGIRFSTQTEIEKDIIKCNLESTDSSEELLIRGMAYRLRNLKGELQGTLLMMFDISDEQKNYNKIYTQSVTDFLTGCFNRTYYNEKIEQYINSGAEFLLAIIDLDRLKNVNDNYGHISGDDYIVKVAMLVKMRLDSAAFVCRIGGDEFAIVSDKITEADMEKALQEVAADLKNMKLPYPAGISYGIGSMQVPDYETFKIMANDIDSRMYKMKRSKSIK